MSDRSTLEVLARLRRQELDATRQALARVEQSIATSQSERRSVWLVADMMEFEASGHALHGRGMLLAAARARSTQLADEIRVLEGLRDGLLAKAKLDLAGCRQIELVAERRALTERRAQLLHQQHATDERTMYRTALCHELAKS
ncbi:MAG TPA: hypothetical protein VNS22_27465 [Geminicoccus sp.]|uniref:hypothetical protein n=1 Tax=Geminicoccus sp. TaxID=2024832 RepID=UPI002B6E40F0|nr:hypothetical protein [Geminicoccus sp.]HWL72099.1 hypothetical protein [Geminicoccus sp.]